MTGFWLDRKGEAHEVSHNEMHAEWAADLLGVNLDKLQKRTNIDKYYNKCDALLKQMFSLNWVRVVISVSDKSIFIDNTFRNTLDVGKLNSKQKEWLSYKSAELGYPVYGFPCGRNSTKPIDLSENSFMRSRNSIRRVKIYEDGEVLSLWFDPRTYKYLRGWDHESMVEKNLEWFGLESDDIIGLPPKKVALQRNFVRVDVFKDYVLIEIRDSQVNGKMKNALSFFAERLGDMGVKSFCKIFVSTDCGNGREYSGTLNSLLSTSMFDERL